MGLIGSAIGAGASIFGGISASKAMKRAKRNIEAQRKKNEDWYDRRYNEDATQRADAVQVLTQTQDMLRRNAEQAAGSAAVTGGTDEGVAQAKASATKTVGDVMSNMNANADKRKDSIEQQYQANDDNYANQLNQMEINKANAIGQAVQGVGNAAGSMDFGTAKMFGKTIDL